MVDSSKHPHPLAKRLGQNISQRRKALGWTQASLAERLDIEPESVSRCERGATLPSLMLLAQYAEVLETTIADLLSECPEGAYSEAQRISAMLSKVGPEARVLVLEMVEKLCQIIATEQQYAHKESNDKIYL